jgi:predicted Zn-dependent peptidase
MTSKLYQSIREDRGLAYAVYSHLNTFTDCGTTLIYAACEPKKARQVFDLTQKELKKLRKNGVTKADLELYKTQVTGQILLGADDIENRMNSLGINEMVFGHNRSPDDVMREVERVSLDSVEAYTKKYIDPDELGALMMGAILKSDAAWLDA